MRGLKRLFRFVVSMRGVVPKLLGSSDAGVIFMLHRFLGLRGPKPGSARPWREREMLGQLRRRGFELIPLATMFERAARREPLRGAIAFTIDDGYRDHAMVAGPLFAEFDCPVTTFLTTGFLDGAIWFWWDVIDFGPSNTAQASTH